MVSKELTKAAGLENVFRMLNKADSTQLAIVTVFAEGFNAGIKAAQTSAELDTHNQRRKKDKELAKQ
ncbi:MAG: hypothetical protein J6D08_14475 [Lachnospiraceae bacterium]|nr:hypothetical protein [Lachnospiraceae bacterium]